MIRRLSILVEALYMSAFTVSLCGDDAMPDGPRFYFSLTLVPNKGWMVKEHPELSSPGALQSDTFPPLCLMGGSREGMRELLLKRFDEIWDAFEENNRQGSFYSDGIDLDYSQK
jgi:hypothetical protein